MSGISLLPVTVSTGSSENSVCYSGPVRTDRPDGLEFRMLTLNCWGLKYVSKLREQRMRFIANELGTSDADIIALQECWVATDYEYLRQRTHKQYPYAKYFYSGILAGSGLVILSRFPIESISMAPYTINGRPSAFFRGDWYVGKGIASAIIRHPSGIAIEVFNTHMHAPYGPGDASYVCHRTSQAWQLARQIRAAVERGHLAIAVGDFNSRPDSLTYALLTKRAGLQDSWTTVHGTSTEHILPASLSPEKQITTLGVTCDSLLNTWRADRDISEAKRLDYCFHAPHLSTVDSVDVTFIDKVPGLNVSASDHFGVSVTLRILPTARSELASGREQAEEGARPPNLPLANYESILDVIASYLPTARAQQYYRLLHFWISIVLVVGLHVGIFWVKSGWPGFLVVLGSTVIAVTGVIDGMLGFLFGRNELRALKEFEEEVRWEMRRMEELLNGRYEDVGSVGKPR
ncbi:Endonuclease/exonuclease/phosphatase [Lipomyces doorenjongii]|uniref:Endonuclease/exonuclease/phosphatase n=1 Tax=Lipomyces doorenjongii TaxID=383834 RepID=UPI0034CD387E